MDIDAVVSKAPIGRPLLVFPTSGKKESKDRRTKNVLESLKDHVEKYDMVAELAYALSDMIFGQLFRVHADEARIPLRGLVPKIFPVTQALVVSPLGGPFPLNSVALNAYGTETHALLGTGSVPNVM